MRRFTVLFLGEAWPQGLPEVLVVVAAPPSRAGPATGAAELIPAAPSSVAPKGISPRPVDEVEGRADKALLPSVQESDALFEIPPPSKVPGGPAL